MSKMLRWILGKKLSGAYILSAYMLIISIVYTIILSAFMFITYKKCHDELTYNEKFNVTLIMLSFLSTILLALIQNNPLLSLGVLGSLSICRVRMNTKDPRDLGFVFWALAIGISSAVGAYFVGITGSVILGVILYLFNSLDYKKDSLMVVVRGKLSELENVQNIFNVHSGSVLQSKNIFTDTFELVYEVAQTEKNEEKIIEQIYTLEGIQGVNVLAPETNVA